MTTLGIRGVQPISAAEWLIEINHQVEVDTNTGIITIRTRETQPVIIRTGSATIEAYAGEANGSTN